MAFTYIIELLQTILATKDAFADFGTGWGNMIELDSVGLLWFSVPILGSVSKSPKAPSIAPLAYGGQ